MRKKKNCCIIFSLILFCLFTTTVFSQAILWKKTQTQNQLTAKFFKQNYFLLNTSSWSLNLDTSKLKLRRSKLGAFAIGNGKVFSLIGLNLPLNTLHNTTGPTYSFPFFADSYIELKTADNKVDLPQQYIWQVKETAIVITKETNDNFELYTINFAPPDLEAIVRIIIVKNISSQTIKNVSVIYKLSADKEEKQNEIVQKRNEKNLSLGSLNKNSYLENGDLIIPLGELKKDEEKINIQYICLNKTPEEKTKTLKKLKQKNLKLLKETNDYWKNWSAHSLKIISLDEKVNDLIEAMKVALKIQQMDNGAQVPVVKYADRSHDRENVNIVRFLLEVGLFKDAKKIIEFGYKAAIKNGQILNSQDILTDINNLPVEPDWDKIPLDNINKDYHSAERPSWTILQFYWYYKYTDDLPLIKKCYNYLKRNLLGQEITQDFLLPFHNDEMYQLTFPLYAAKVKLDKMYSADSSFVYVSAAEAMTEIAKDLKKFNDAEKFKDLADKVRTATEKYYWLNDFNFYAPAMLKDTQELIKIPFSDIDLKPVWTGFTKDLNKEKQNLLQIMKYLLRSDNTLMLAKSADVYHGQIPGLFLYNLTFFDHPLAENVFNTFDFIADAAGQFSEAHRNNHLPICMNIDTTGFGKEDARRLGPWEGSVNVYSIIYYLTGIKVDTQKNELTLFPHLPNNWKKLKVKNCFIKNNLIEFTVSDLNNERIYLIKNLGKTKINLNLSISLKKAEIKNLKINNKNIKLSLLAVENEWDCVRIKNIKINLLPQKKVEIKTKYVKLN